MAEREGEGNGFLPEAAGAAVEMFTAAGASVVVELAEVDMETLKFHLTVAPEHVDKFSRLLL